MADIKRGTGMKKSTRARRYGQEPAGKRTPSRAHRDDTPEARQQQMRSPKTHPTRGVGAMRKDKNTGGGIPSAPTQPPTVREPPAGMRRRGIGK